MAMDQFQQLNEEEEEEEKEKGWGVGAWEGAGGRGEGVDGGRQYFLRQVFFCLFLSFFFFLSFIYPSLHLFSPSLPPS